MNRLLKLVLCFICFHSLDSYSGGEESYCETVPLVAVIANPQIFDGKYVAVVGVLGYKRGLSSTLFPDRFSHENNLVGNGIYMNVGAGVKNLEEADGMLGLVCGVINADSARGSFPDPRFQKIEFIEAGSARWEQGEWKF